VADADGGEFGGVGAGLDLVGEAGTVLAQRGEGRGNGEWGGVPAHVLDQPETHHLLHGKVLLGAELLALLQNFGEAIEVLDEDGDGLLVEGRHFGGLTAFNCC
jgi:hypothetical protein